MLKFKPGVQLTITEAINKILDGVNLAYLGFNVPCVVTSGSDGKHMKQSKHYTNEALDFRISDIQPQDLQPIVKACKEILGKDFDVVLEGNHLHVEYDPKVKGK